MPTDIFVVRITPAKGPKTGTTFPWIVVSELSRRQTVPRPKLKIRDSGYKECVVENDLAGPAKRSELKKVALELGMAILRASKNVTSHAK